MTLSERTVLERVNGLLDESSVRSAVEAAVARVRRDLHRNSDSVMAWEPLPASVFGTGLPGGVHSAWVFILRAGVNTGPERHPNSRQRMMSHTGSGDLQTRPHPDQPWQSNHLMSDSSRPLEERWISIAQNTWHQPVVPTGEDWVVVSFHTVPAEELIEERPATNSDSETRQKRYIT